MLNVIIVAIKVIINARLIKLPQRQLRHNLTDLPQRPHTAGKRNEGIAKLNHLRLALCHILGNYQLRQSLILIFLIYKKLRLHTDNLTTCLQNAVRQLTHQTSFITAINQSITACTNPCTKLAYRCYKIRVVACR